MKHIHFPLILLTIMLACNLFTACNDDEGGGIPVIHHIRLTDPEKADSTFTDVNPGTMIVAIGENLNGVKKVFINQQEVSFNYNPQNEMFRLLGTKRSFSQNETFFFSHP